MRKTKIICTLGPASSSYDVLKKMAQAGMDVVRLNFSHGSHEEHKQKINLIKKLRDEMDLPLPILLDTKGPEIRIGTFENDKIFLNEGDIFSFTTNQVIGSQTMVYLNYPTLLTDLKIGSKILINNGLMEFEVLEVLENEIKTVCRNSGALSNKKSVSLPNIKISLPYLSDDDKADLIFGIENDIDFIAASFVRNKNDITLMRNFLEEHGGEKIDIIAKIENREGVDNLDEIIEESNGIMVARGDLGVEIPFEQLPPAQKAMISKSRYQGKRVITATEMLESMITNTRPTRAEISDVANAVYDGTSAIMLSGETAVGINPVAVIKTMSKIAHEAEKNINYSKRFKNIDLRINSPVDAISHATCTTAIDINAKAIVVCTTTGSTARMVSRFRPETDIIGLTTNHKVYRKLALSWGVIPMITQKFVSTDDLFAQARLVGLSSGLAKKGDMILITAGIPLGGAISTNLIKIDQL